MAMETKLHGYTLKIIPDDSPLNPRTDCDHLGTMLCWHRRYFLSELEYIQSSFGSDLLLNYQRIEKCCREYDQNTGSNTQRHLEGSDFVYGETLDMLVLSEAKDLTKLFHFMRKLEHVNDEIYILDAYGSLRNAEVSDLECLIEDIQRTVNNNDAAFNKSDTEMG